ncbi:MAG: HlyC/CorC family transporter, partial [Alphaproteobacteria bacterium]|nr:HlyC/CorC family transporter [Alphaproteobacteria bacterium]
MTLAELLTVAAIVLLIALSAFFSGSETALTAARRSRIHHLASEGDARAGLVARLIARRERMIGAILLGNNAVNILASTLAAGLMIGLVGEAGIAYATITMTLLVVVFAEVLPKTYAIRHADRAALAVAPILRPIIAALAPITAALQTVVIGLLRMVGAGGEGRWSWSVADEIRGVVDLHAREGGIRKHYRDMLRSVLDLAEVEVGEIMVHRRDMVTISAALAPADIVAQVLASPFTRIPLWRDEPDNIVGVLHAKSLLQAVQAQAGDIDQLDVVSLAIEPWFVPDTTSLANQLTAFRGRRAHFALVVDEYGALMGLVTLEDILEEIVGDITDEHDRPTGGVRRTPDGGYLVDGAVTIRDLNRDLDWRLPDDAAATIAGLVIHEARRIPKVGQV